jgi:hypothetical protein
MSTSQMPQGRHRGLSGARGGTPDRIGRRLLAWATIGACLYSNAAQAANYLWGGTSSDWTNARAWSPSGVPTAGDSVTVNSGQVNASGATKTLSNLILGGGTVTGGDLLASGLTFASGTLGSNLTVTGAAQFDGNGYQNINAATTVTLQGSSTWSAGTGFLNNASTINNALGATFVDMGSGAPGLSRNIGGINNAGTYIRNGLGTTVMMSLGLSNSGTLDIRSGELLLNGASSSSGLIKIGTGATLSVGSLGNITSTVSTIAGAVTGDGLLRVNSGTLNLNRTASFSGQLEVLGGVFTNTGDRTMSSFTLNSTRSGTGSITTANFVFNGGSLSGSGTTTVTGTATIGTTKSHSVAAGHTLNLQGSSTWLAGAGSIRSNGALHNTAGATFLDEGAGTATGSRSLTATALNPFDNAGSYVRTGVGSTRASYFNNSGSLSVQGGTFQLEAGNNASTGLIDVGQDGVLHVTTSTLTVSGAITGKGLVRVSGSGNTAGTLVLTSTAMVSNTTLEIAGVGTLDNQIDRNVSRLVMSGGTRSGLGNITTESLLFAGGTLSGNTTTTVTGAATLAGGNATQMIAAGHTLTLQGSTTWEAGDYAKIDNSGTLRNIAGATFTDLGTSTATGTRYISSLVTTDFINAGTYVREGLGTTIVQSNTFTNSGTLDIRGGTFQMVSNSTSSGAIQVAAGAMLDYAGGTSTISGSVAGEGLVRLSGGALTLADTATVNSTLELMGATLINLGNRTLPELILNGGTRAGSGNITTSAFTFNSGQLASTSTTTVTGAASFGGTSSLTVNAHTLNLQGRSTWQAGDNGINNTGVINNAQGAVFNDAGTTTASGTRYLTGSSTTKAFNNAGSYVRTGLGSTQASYFNNTGTLQVQGGVFQLMTGSTSSGLIDLAAGTTLTLGTGVGKLSGLIEGDGLVRVASSVALNNTLAFSGALELQTGTLDNQSSRSLTSLVLNGGTRSGVGDITTATLAFNGGTLTGASSTTVTGSAALSTNNSIGVATGHTLRLLGQTTWSAGDGLVNNTGTIVNATGAVFTDAGTTGRIRYVSNGAGTFMNAGTYVREGLGTTGAQGFNNTGRLQINGGTFQVSSFVNQGVVNIAQGGVLTSNSSTFGNAGQIVGNGTVRTASNAHALTNTGTIDPGAAGSIGHLTVEGDLSLGIQSILHIDLGSSNTADLISVSDQLTLGGSLQLGLLDGALLHEGDVFTIATFASSLGSGFTSVDWGGAGGYGFSVVYNAHDIQLRVASVPMPVPEPANAALALCALVLMRLRRRPASAPSRPR